MFCPCLSPIFKMNTPEILYKTESSFEIMLSESKMNRKWQTFCLLLIYLKRSTEQKGHFLKLWYLKWKGVDRDRTLHILGWNWTADFSWYSWSNTVQWLVSQTQTVLWLGGEPFKIRISRVAQTDRQTDIQSDLIDCWTAYFSS